MNSKQKLSKVKSFTRGKMNEFYDALIKHDNKNEDNLFEQFDWDNIIVHLKNYTIHNYGVDLIEIPLTTEINEHDADKMEYLLGDIAQSERLGLYFTIANDVGKLYIFNKALNVHVKDYNLLLLQEKENVRNIIESIKSSVDNSVISNLNKLKNILKDCDSVYVTLENDLMNEEDGVALDTMEVEGVIDKIDNKYIQLDYVYFVEKKTKVKIDDYWTIKTIGIWETVDQKELKIKLNLDKAA